MFQDLIFGIRMLRRNPGVSMLAVLCLTLGIGATTAVFSWIEGILLRPFPMVAAQDRMFSLTGMDREGRTDVSWPDIQDLRRSCTLVDAFIAEHIGGATLNIGERADRVTGSVVSSNYFDVLGIRPILGRTFQPEEDIGRGAHPVTVISYEMWRERYGGDPNIVGQTQLLNGVRHTIIGVTPEGFYGTFVGYSFRFWVPASMEDVFEGGGYKLEDRGARWIEGFAILKPGVTGRRAQAEISAVGARLAAEYPDTNRGRSFKLYPLWQTPFNNAGTLLPTLRALLVVAFMVLLIACANVGNLLLLKSFRRRHEMAVRMSLGAGRARLARQLLTEGLILAVVSAAGAFLAAYWCRNLIQLQFPPSAAGIVIHLPAHMDLRVLAVSAAVCLLSTLLFGLAPALQSGRIDLAAAIKAESGGVAGGRRKAWVRSGLVLAQVSLSFVLLVGAGLLLKSFRTAQQTDVGFSTDNVLVSWVDMIAAGYSGPRIRNFQDQLVDRVQALGGVQSMAWSRSVPFTYRSYPSSPIQVDGFETRPGEQPSVDYNEVGEAYFSTMGLLLVWGREFTRADNDASQPVTIVNETVAQRFWPGENPIGKRLRVKGRWLQVIGVARNSKYSSMLETSKPFLYTPLRQSPAGGMNFQIRTRLAPAAIAGALAREIKAIDPNLAPGEVITMRENIARRTWSRRAAFTLLAIFASIALLLAGIGLYGVMSFAVSQGKREMGLRMALGAGSSDLLRIVMAQGMGLTLAGTAAGAAVALGLTRLLGDMLYKVSPRDPESFVAAFAAITLAAVAACLPPAWRATRTDPLRALRDS